MDHGSTVTYKPRLLEMAAPDGESGIPSSPESDTTAEAMDVEVLLETSNDDEPGAANEGHNSSPNMTSNLPLLFANGYPISLAKITEQQLEKFIPFMLQCATGGAQQNAGASIEAPPDWWPDDLPFSIPLVRPSNYDSVSNPDVSFCNC